jgi:sec-independent protein translocase protein TatA
MDPLQLAIIGIVIVVFIVLGPKKIPELARALGMAKKEFDQGAKGPDGAGGTPSSTMAGAQMGEDDLMVAAKRLGISTEGKTRDQISAEIVRKTAGA